MKGTQRDPSFYLIIAAAPGTLMLKFKYVISPKATIDQILEWALKRPVPCCKLIDGRPLPIAIGLPLDDADETFVGAEAVVLPGFGVVDPYNGTFWKTANEWGATVVANWKIWLREPAQRGALILPAA
jgi:hypothetical protein